MSMKSWSHPSNCSRVWWARERCPPPYLTPSCLRQMAEMKRASQSNVVTALQGYAVHTAAESCASSLRGTKAVRREEGGREGGRRERRKGGRRERREGGRREEGKEGRREGGTGRREGGKVGRWEGGKEGDRQT